MLSIFYSFLLFFYFLLGNGTVALEVLEDLPNVSSIIVPYGGGGLASGIGTVVENLKPSVNVITSELDSSPQVKSYVILLNAFFYYSISHGILISYIVWHKVKL